MNKFTSAEPTVGNYVNRSVIPVDKMTKTITYKGWIFDVDFDRTKHVYDKIQRGSPEICRCNDCKNFASNRDNIYPIEVKNLLKELGIDYKKESEIYHLARLDNGLHQYGGWFHFKGTITIGIDCKIDLGGGRRSLDITPVTDRFGIGFTKDWSLTYFEDIDRNSLIQVEFIAESEWVIDKILESQ